MLAILILTGFCLLASIPKSYTVLQYRKEKFSIAKQLVFFDIQLLSKLTIRRAFHGSAIQLYFQSNQQVRASTFIASSIRIPAPAMTSRFLRMVKSYGGGTGVNFYKNQKTVKSNRVKYLLITITCLYSIVTTIKMSQFPFL